MANPCPLHTQAVTELAWQSIVNTNRLPTVPPGCSARDYTRQSVLNSACATVRVEEVEHMMHRAVVYKHIITQAVQGGAVYIIQAMVVLACGAQTNFQVRVAGETCL